MSELITRRLQEVLNLELLNKIIAVRPLKIYWGTAPTGRIHLGYLVPLLKIADFLQAGCQVTILFADIHAYLDTKSSLEKLESRTQYYREMIIAILRELHVPIDQLKFVVGSSFQKSEKYVHDVYRLMSIQSLHDAKKAGSEVVKQSVNPKMSSLIYPGMQGLDEEYLDVDAQFGGIDQRKIFTMAEEYLPSLGYKKRIHLMNPMLTAINARPGNSSEVPSEISPGLRQEVSELSNLNSISELSSKLEELAKKLRNSGPEKMSASDPNSKIDILDTPNQVKKKINSAYCVEGDMSFNPLMELMKLVIFPLLELQGRNFEISRPEQYGGNVTYSNLESVTADFREKKLHPQDLKSGITGCLNSFFDPIRTHFQKPELVQLIKLAY